MILSIVLSFSPQYLKQKLWAGNLWEASYFVRSVGEGVTGEMVKRYIEKHSEAAQNSVQAELFTEGALRPKRKSERRT
jgi:REP element-mobilizing transposase RayT